MKTVVLANGVFPTHPIPLRLLGEANLIVCCDAAILGLANYLRNNTTFANQLRQGDGTMPIQIAVVGDGDSLHPSSELEQLFVDHGSPLIFFSSRDQETNDLTKAIRFATGRGARNVDILGATGLREDHTLGNISLLADYSELITVRMFTNYGWFTPIQFSSQFASFPNQQVSIFNLTPEFTLTSRGLQYPIIDRAFPRWWEGTLNACLGNEFTIIINSTPHAATPSRRQAIPHVLVYQTYEAKQV